MKLRVEGGESWGPPVEVDVTDAEAVAVLTADLSAVRATLASALCRALPDVSMFWLPHVGPIRREPGGVITVTLYGARPCAAMWHRTTFAEVLPLFRDHAIIKEGRAVMDCTDEVGGGPGDAAVTYHLANGTEVACLSCWRPVLSEYRPDEAEPPAWYVRGPQT